MINAFRLLFGIGEDVLAEVAGGIEAWVERVERTAGQLKKALLVPFSLFVLAMLIGGFGQSESGDKAAQCLMDFACLTGIVMLLGVAFNASVLAQILSYATLAARKAIGDKVPTLDPKAVASMTKMLLVAMGWIATVSTIALFIPLWRSVHWTMVITIGSLALTFIAASWGFKSAALKYALSALVLGAVIAAALQFNGSFKRFGIAGADNALVRLDRLSGKLETDATDIAQGKTETASASAQSTPSLTQTSVVNEPPPAPEASAALDAATASGHSDAAVNNAPPPSATTAPKPRAAGSLAKQIDDQYPGL